MMHFLQLETSWHCAALWVVVPSAPPNNLANERKSLKSNHFEDFFVYAGMEIIYTEYYQYR